ncbi:MMPL family transporter [Pseudolysinimonas sp.]|jgi:RND superfamily putative drug exporter|uniref:MMPL family transporter n=1 Tax=Pseudolysinimonas sp. TaxID=2680009 RepID=UPI003782D5AD
MRLPSLVGRLRSWIVLAFAVLLSGAAFALIPAEEGTSFPASGLADTVESAQVAALLEEAPSGDTTVGIVVITRADGDDLDAGDIADASAAAERLADLAIEPRAVVPVPSDDGSAVLIVVPLEQEAVNDDVAAAATELRDAAADGLPDALEARLSGPVGFQADISDAFAGADFRLLAITAAVVGILLIITYRSPVLWIVPLLTVGIADGLARVVVGWLAPLVGIDLDPSVSGIQSVLVFGAGTNYALLLVARYREELIRQQDRVAAMRTALRHAGPAILASGGTVAAALLLLLLGDLGGTRALGFACAVGIGIALLFGLLVLPAALVVCGRGLFWPLVPKYDPEADPQSRSLWARIGRRVAARPAVVAGVAVLGLAVLASGLVGAKVGLSQTDQILGDPESVQAQRIIEEAYPAGLTAQTVVLAPSAGADDVVALAQGVDGVESVRAGESWDDLTRIDVTLDAEPQSDDAFAVIADLRTELRDAGGEVSEALVGGSDATAFDVRTASSRDQALILPLIALVVLVILALLLRSLVAPFILVATVLTTFFASLGASNFVFQQILGFPAFDTSVLLFGFLFLVALGVDYNIFLVTRAREERVALPTRPAMIRALGGTGAVITSAGILLAAVFVVLGVLPVVALAQIGVIVCIGVLLDTLVVRTVLVPALVFLLGDRFWWPAKVPSVDAA